MSISTVVEILKSTIEREKELSHYYGRIYKIIKNERSRKAVAVLKEQQERALGFLNQLHFQQYEGIGFIEAPPDNFVEAIEFMEDSSPEEIFAKVLAYENKLKEYYEHLSSVLVYKEAQELFDMIVRAKVFMITRIKVLMDSYDLVV